MNKVTSFITSLFSDESGNISMKRMIALICAICLCYAFVRNYTSDLTDAIVIICCVAMGATTIDKFSKFNKNAEGQ